MGTFRRKLISQNRYVSVEYIKGDGVAYIDTALKRNAEYIYMK